MPSKQHKKPAKEKTFIHSNKLISHLPQKLGLDANLDCSFMHFPVVCNKNRVGELGTGDKEIIKTADFSFNCHIYSFIEKISVIDDVPVGFNIIRGLDSNLILPGQSCSNSCNFNY